ncbi:MAG TPA: glycosyltransferase [Paludibacter sp.]
MKVLWFSNSPASGAEYLKSGGIGGGWLSALDQPLGKKIELHIAFYYPKFAKPFIYKDVYYHPICKKNFKWNWVKQLFYNKLIDGEDLSFYMNIIYEVKPDVIHILGTENSFGIITKHTEIPIVVSIQGNITVYKQKYFAGIETRYAHLRDTSSLLAFLNSRSFFEYFVRFERFSQIELRNLSTVKHIIGRTNWDRRIMSIMAVNAQYYHNEEVLRKAFYEHQWVPEKREKLIIHTTNGNSIYKGFETLCEALFEINQLGIPIEWRVAGIKESDIIVQMVKKKLNSRFPNSGLVLLGGINESDLVEKLLEADMYVMPSHIENSPNNLCEAMILGMPCIATFAGGTGSMLKDGEEGILIQDGDPWVLAGAILELRSKPEKAIEYGIKAREKALKRHNSDNIVNSLIDIYSTIIENGEKN